MTAVKDGKVFIVNSSPHGGVGKDLAINSIFHSGLTLFSSAEPSVLKTLHLWLRNFFFLEHYLKMTLKILPWGNARRCVSTAEESKLRCLEMGKGSRQVSKAISQLP